MYTHTHHPFMACSGLQAHQTARISLISRLRLAFTLHTWNFQSLELSVLPDCRPPTGSSKLSSNVMAVFFDLSKESESPLPLGSVPPPHRFHSPSKQQPTRNHMGLVPAEPPVAKPCLAHSRCTHRLHRWLNDRGPFLW